ncbi:MAG: hypothetical protein D6701_01765 [Gemmatimonadetes bacterium]|nr:MAG: hypothetical protein D6701_01765 [Gemmatimonadota bacterium]
MTRATLPAALAVAVLLALAPPHAAAQLTRPLSEQELESMRWRSIGPANMGGRVTDVEGLPTPSKTFFVATATGGIWKTTNNGITFRPVFQFERVASMGDVAIAPSDSMIVWAGTGEEDSRNSISPGGGIYKSTDGGLTWTLMGLEATQVIGRIVIHPTDPDIVYVAALGHIWGPNSERGLYRTKDGGQTWELVKFISDRAGFVDIAMRPDDPNTIFASSWERVRGPYFLNSGGPGSALWKSTDGGDTWTEVTGGGFPEAMKGRIGLAISLSDPDVMYALVEAEEEEDGSGGSGLYRSEDGGETWEKVNDANTRPFYYSQVRVDPLDPDRVYWSSTPVQFSNDGGRTAGTTTNDIHVDHHAMWIDPVDPERIIVGNDGGVAISWDRGGNWEYLNAMAIGQFYHVSYNMDVPYRVCGGLQDNGTWCGPSRVRQGEITNYHWATINGGDGFYSAQDPVESNVVFAESQGGNIARIDMATGARTGLRKPSWQEAWRPLQDSIVMLQDEEGNPVSDEAAARIAELQARASADSAALELRYNWSTPFFLSPHDRFTLYVGASRVLKSTNRGEDLVPISPDLTTQDEERIRVSTQTTGGITPDVTGAETHSTIVALAESPLRQGLLFAGTDDGNVWMSPDDGGEWIDLTGRFPGVPPKTWVSRIEPSHFDPDRFYVTFDGHRDDDFTPYVFVTDDGGASFRTIASDLPTGGPDFVHVIREDPFNEHLLFVGTDVGAYVSTDGGGHWQRFMTGLPTVPVHDLEIHPRDRELIAATHGRSIWIVDIQPLEELTDAVADEPVVLFEPKEPIFFGQEPRGGESYGHQFFQRPTPGQGMQIGYRVAEGVGPATDGGPAVQPARGGDAETPRGGGARAGRGGGGAGPGGFAARNRATLTITDAEGTVVRTLTGSARPGIHTFTWNLRGEAPPRPELSPSERRDSAQVAARVEVVVDSLVAEGWDETELRNLTGFFTGGPRPGFFGGGRGGGQAGRDPEAFVERPGERMGGGGRGGFNFGRIRQLASLIRPGASVGSLFRRGGGGGQAPLVDPGTYTFTLKVGEHEVSRTVEVRVPEALATDDSGFEDDEAAWERWLERLLEGG